ncbi:hypothetical protein [Aureitalea marina]|uniref:Uncharacterized protein n=1 Tax=Aureitalea marina TaxID=930804 RepID=A0A2S7KN85_9FLAO|nr:hypothetical protein [Aureitalea marina]PQB04072.1 hypothetical protein BST85_03520 [Aureitalea marina]
MKDQEFLTAFGSAQLPPDQFDHKAHLRLAYLQIKQHGRDTASELISKQIKDYTIHWGAATKYHQTLTQAAVYTMSQFMDRKPELGFEDLLRHFPRLLTGFNELIGQHYSKDLLASEEARERYLEPDKLPFDVA